MDWGWTYTHLKLKTLKSFAAFWISKKYAYPIIDLWVLGILTNRMCKDELVEKKRHLPTAPFIYLNTRFHYSVFILGFLHELIENFK